MMHEFISANRGELIQRCRTKVAQRPAPQADDQELQHGVPLFLEQLIKTLQVEQAAGAHAGDGVSGPAGGDEGHSEIGESAGRHGAELLLQGLNIDQVVHNYGDVCQAITDLAFEQGVTLEVDEFRTLNRCLDTAIARAVTEFSCRREEQVAGREAQTLNERLGILAHELRDHIQTATLAFAALKHGTVGAGGATGAVLDRSLSNLRGVVDRSLADVRITAGLPALQRRISVADLIVEVKVAAALEARAKGRGFIVPAVDAALAVNVDRDLLLSAIGNLLQNAFKFTQEASDVILTAYGAGDHVRIDVQDHCGGLPAAAAEKMFRPFEQLGPDRTGLGLGLTICRRSVEANHGTLSVRDLPGSGCVFTIELPRHTVATQAAASA
ncbi:MAG TPA: HAMP domain-containing sensor histidine kinase [Candidatus Binatia bacterium]|nr:HAMP domain-containing sensor histidine kinase [Candidatus Binatia bacterium]